MSTSVAATVLPLLDTPELVEVPELLDVPELELLAAPELLLEVLLLEVELLDVELLLDVLLGVVATDPVGLLLLPPQALKPANADAIIHDPTAFNMSTPTHGLRKIIQ